MRVAEGLAVILQVVAELTAGGTISVFHPLINIRAHWTVETTLRPTPLTEALCMEYVFA